MRGLQFPPGNSGLLCVWIRYEIFTMNQLFSIICLLFVLLCGGCSTSLAAAEPAPCRWEIVSEIYLGVQSHELSPEERQDLVRYGVPKRQGLKVVGIAPGSPAERAGMQVGDYILKYNGASIKCPADLLLAMRNTKPGEYGHFDIWRAGARMPLPVLVGALPQPRVLGYISLGREALPLADALQQKQKELAVLLSANVPSLADIRSVVREIHSILPSAQRTGSLRLYYRVPSGQFSITAYPDKITVALYQTESTETYHIRKQGDSLPAHVRAILRMTADN